MGMDLSMGMELRQDQSARMELGMNITQTLKMMQLMRDREFPNATKGIEGLRVSNEILKRRQSIGVLVGGLSELVWNRNRTEEELAERKDVDVMVLNPSFEPEGEFEGGIDWWKVRKETVEIVTDITRFEKEQEWWENGNGVALNFVPRVSEGTPYPYENMAPGLYIPDCDAVIQMRLEEASTTVDDERVQLSIGTDEMIDGLKNRLRKIVKRTLAPQVAHMFASQILSHKYRTAMPPITFAAIPHENRVAIGRWKVQK